MLVDYPNPVNPEWFKNSRRFKGEGLGLGVPRDKKANDVDNCVEGALLCPDAGGENLWGGDIDERAQKNP